MSDRGAELGGEWEGVSPPQPTRESGERRELPQRGPGRSPGRKRFCYFLGAPERLLLQYLSHILHFPQIFGA